MRGSRPSGSRLFPHNALCVPRSAHSSAFVCAPPQTTFAAPPHPLGVASRLLCSALFCLAIVNWQQAAGSQVILNKHIFQASQRKHFLLPRLPPGSPCCPFLKAANKICFWSLALNKLLLKRQQRRSQADSRAVGHSGRGTVRQIVKVKGEQRRGIGEGRRGCLLHVDSAQVSN